MKKQAISLGLKLIELERKVNNHFANGTITEKLQHDCLNKAHRPKSDWIMYIFQPA